MFLSPTMRFERAGLANIFDILRKISFGNTSFDCLMKFNHIMINNLLFDNMTYAIPHIDLCHWVT